MFSAYLFVFLNAAGAFPLGLAAGIALVCGHSGLTPAEVAKATAESARALWGRISSDAPAPVREPIEPADHPLAPTLDDLADDAEADPICHAVAAGAPFTLSDHPGLGCLSLVQHLQAHGRTYGQAIDQAAALLEVSPRSLEAVIGRNWPRQAAQRPTTDAELATFTPDQVLAQAFPQVYGPDADPELDAVDAQIAAGKVLLDPATGGQL
jgi:hypothetical protein